MTDKDVLRPIATLEDLGPDPGNANKGTDKGRAVVAASLAECGAGRSILADRDGTVIAGNKTLEAARKLGLPVRVIESNGEELVVVRRTDLDLGTDEKARRLAYLDNRAGQLGLDWDTEQMLEDLRRGVDLEGIFDEAELKKLLGDTGAGNAAADPGAQLDRADELQEKWGVEKDQLWLAGKHRILCGDCIDESQARTLMGGAWPQSAGPTRPGTWPTEKVVTPPGANGRSPTITWALSSPPLPRSSAPSSLTASLPVPRYIWP